MKRSYETCLEPASSPCKRITILKPQIHPFLLSKPLELCQDLWLLCGKSDHLITAVNAQCRVETLSLNQLTHYSGLFTLYDGSGAKVSMSGTYEAFARCFLYYLPNRLASPQFKSPKTLKLRSLNEDGCLCIYTSTGDIIIARDEATVPFLVLDKLNYAFSGWAITMESHLHEISSFKDFRLERL